MNSLQSLIHVAGGVAELADSRKENSRPTYFVHHRLSFLTLEPLGTMALSAFAVLQYVNWVDS